MFFKVLQDQVHTKLANGTPENAKAQIEVIRTALKSNAQVARYVSGAGKDDGFSSQVQKVYEELTGKTLTAFLDEPHWARRAHAHAHGFAS